MQWIINYRRTMWIFIFIDNAKCGKKILYDIIENLVNN
jgi:hypothetical protein